MAFNKRLVQYSAVLGFWGVTSGAFGAHALKSQLSEYAMSIWQTAVLYLFVHTMVVLFLALLNPNKLTKRAALCFLSGCVVFSGSLQLLALTGTKWLGAITPIGGGLFIAGWCYLFILGYQFNKKN